MSHYDFQIYAEGLCYASVCTSLSDEETTRRMPVAGTSLGWHVAEGGFHDGTPNGIGCPDHPTTHRHLLFAC